MAWVWPSNRQITGKKYSRFIAIAIMIAVYFGSYNLAAIKKPQTGGGYYCQQTVLAFLDEAYQSTCVCVCCVCACVCVCVCVCVIVWFCDFWFSGGTQKVLYTEMLPQFFRTYSLAISWTLGKIWRKGYIWCL